MASILCTSLTVLTTIVTHHLVTSCSFPETLHMEPRDPPWASHIRADGSSGAEYYIRHNVMEIHYPKSERQHVRWKCSMAYHGKLLLRREDIYTNYYYRCIQFMFRSKSVVQIMWSQEAKAFDLGLCDDKYLKLDPWPLIWYGTLEEDYTPCPFTGGFDMKLTDSQLGESGCNLMLRPMRMEAECTGGEGVIFNFISSNCLPDISMYVVQKTMCLTSWQDSRNHYVILRRNEDTDLWCLVMPIHRTRDVKAYLFSDLVCRSDTENLASVTDVKFFTLQLHVREFPSLCEDEYEQCSKVECNNYVKNECQKSCHKCDTADLPQVCEYPRRFAGTWFLKDSDGFSQAEITKSNFSVAGVGNFLCTSFPDSPGRKSRVYTAVSLYKNGCRPRYTCVKFHRLGPSVLQYSISQSYVWPNLEGNLGASICNDIQFQPDPSPIDDRYRPYQGTGKPIIAQSPKPEPVHCNLTSVYTLSATLPEGYICSGSLYKHCEDQSKLRLEFGSCGSLVPASTDYQCLANFEGHYWERIVLVQNLHDEMDVICFVFSQFYPNEAYALVASQCDQKSFNFARTGLRQPLLKLEYRSEAETCKSVPIVPTTTMKSAGQQVDYPNSNNALRNDAHKDTLVADHIDSSGARKDPPIPVSIVVTGSPSGKSGQEKEGVYNDAGSAPDAPRAKSTSHGGGDSLRSSNHNNEAKTLTSPIGWLFLLLTLSLSTCVMVT